jgi:negative regulator of flagellin synthesis FlgM
MNNIGNITFKYEHQALINETMDKTRTENRGNQPVEKAQDMDRDDKVSLSQASKDMQTAKTAVAATPDVRENKVSAIRQAVEQGQYHVDAEKVAESFVGSIISEMA